MELKLRKTGNSLATTWPKEILNRLKVGEGDKLYTIETPHGVLVTPYDPKFELGHDLGSSSKNVHLNHPHCAKFCVLGGASCSVV